MGRRAIATMWEAERDGPDERFALSAEIVAVDGQTAVVRTEVHYEHPRVQTFRDLWIITFDADGLCAAFEEWPFAPEYRGWFASGPDRP